MERKTKITKQCVLAAVTCSLLFTCMGCEAFVRKFTRKPKAENLPKETMVLVPEEYHAAQMSREALYRQYFVFWKSWQEELIESLSGNSVNKKKQLSCLKEAIKNLTQLTPLLNEAMQARLAGYLAQEKALEEAVKNDIYGNYMASQRRTAERILRTVSRNFSYSKIKDEMQ